MPSKATSKRPVSRPFGPPMLCNPLDEVPTDPQLLASIKYDGWRTRASVDGGGTLTSREGNPITAVPYVQSALGDLAAAGTVLDGELVDLAGPRQLKRTGTILGSPTPHRPTAQDPPLTFAIFDLLMCAGEDLRDMPLRERLARLAKLFENPDVRPHTTALIEGRSEPTLLLVEHRRCESAWAQALVVAGHEGVVVKLPDSLYVHGARNRGWWKWKPQQTLDGQCTQVVPGKAGAIGSLGFRLESGVEGTVSSGISELEWLDMTSHPEHYVGHMIELSYLDIEASGLLRSPVYRGKRHPDDKAAPAKAPRAPRRLPDAKARAAAASGGKRRRRSYEKMVDPKKLERCIAELRAQEGDAYDRCLERGSGDPAGDLAFALDVARERGLSV